MAAIVLTVRVAEGDEECIAEIKELGLLVKVPTRTTALFEIRRLLTSHCEAVRAGTIQNASDEVGPRHFIIAMLGAKLGFELRTEEMEPAKLAELLAKIPHVLEHGDGTGQLFWVSGHDPHPNVRAKCAKLGGRCAFRQAAEDWKALNEPATIPAPVIL